MYSDGSLCGDCSTSWSDHESTPPCYFPYHRYARQKGNNLWTRKDIESVSRTAQMIVNVALVLPRKDIWTIAFNGISGNTTTKFFKELPNH